MGRWGCVILFVDVGWRFADWWGVGRYGKEVEEKGGVEGGLWMGCILASPGEKLGKCIFIIYIMRLTTCGRER